MLVEEPVETVRAIKVPLDCLKLEKIKKEKGVIEVPSTLLSCLLSLLLSLLLSGHLQEDIMQAYT